MSDCIFCAIARGEAPATMLREEEDVIAFRDLNPQAPLHALVVPRLHIESAADLTPEHDALWVRMLRVAQDIAQAEGVRESGYRLVTSVGRDAGQTVPHLHVHLLGGRRMSWPPG